MNVVVPKYRLRESIGGVQGVPRGGMRMVTIPAGEILELTDIPARFGIVEVLWEGKQTGVLIKDISAHADLIEGVSA